MGLRADVRRELTLALSRGRDPREHSPNCEDEALCLYCTDLVDHALLPAVERALSKRRTLRHRASRSSGVIRRWM